MCANSITQVLEISYKSTFFFFMIDQTAQLMLNIEEKTWWSTHVLGD